MRKTIAFFSLLIIFLLPIFFGCKKEENPVTPPSEHFEPEGWLIRDATTKPILVVWQGTIQKVWDGNPISDTLEAPLSALSDHLTVKFLDANKKILNPPTASDHSFGWLISDTSMLAIVQDNPQDWAFHLKGKKIGKTSLELQVRHLGHVDVKTPKIPVRIITDTTKHGEPEAIRLRYEETGALIAAASQTASTGEIVVKKDSTTKHIVVDFQDENGKYFQPEFPLHSLGIQIGDATIARVMLEPDEPWVFRISGLKIGTTQIIVKLIVNGEAEFTSHPLLLRVQ